MNTLGLYGFISLFAHLTVATGWAFFHSWEHHRQSLARSWGCRCTNEPQPSPAEPDPGQQNCPDEPRPQRNPGLTPCVLLASGWATGTRLVAFPPVEWGYALLPPCPVLSHHPSFFAMCLQGMPQAMLHFRPSPYLKSYCLVTVLFVCLLHWNVNYKDRGISSLWFPAESSAFSSGAGTKQVPQG